jgi:hypothetical protein
MPNRMNPGPAKELENISSPTPVGGGGGLPVFTSLLPQISRSSVPAVVPAAAKASTAVIPSVNWTYGTGLQTIHSMSPGFMGAVGGAIAGATTGIKGAINRFSQGWGNTETTGNVVNASNVVNDSNTNGTNGISNADFYRMAKDSYNPFVADSGDYENRILASVIDSPEYIEATTEEKKTILQGISSYMGQGINNTEPTGPKDGDMKLSPDGQPLIFRNGRWEVYGVRNTREIITEDPNKEPVPGADANVPIDKYMESLGTDTLAGKAYAEALARRMASIDEQQRTAGLSYGDMYEQARMSQAARRGMSDVSGMTGGMQDQLSSRMSAAEIASLGQIGMGREATMRQLEQQELDAPMAAFEEGRQIEAYERSKAMMDRDMQQAQTLFEQAQSGWVQNEDGTWTNIDKQTQDTLSLQAINATQRAEVLGEIQYWQSYLTSNPGNQQALTTLTDLQAQYATLLSQSKDLAAQRTPTTDDVDVDVDDDVVVEPEGFVRTTGQTTQSAAVDFTKSRLNQIGITDASLENPINILKPRFQNQEDIAEAVVELAGDKAVEGYNFTEEIELVTKVLTDPTSITFEEFKEIKENSILFDSTARYYGVYGWRFSRSTVAGKITEQFMFNDTPQNRELVEYLLENGQVKEDNISIKDGKYTIKSNFNSGSQNQYEKYVLDFSRRSTE